MTAQKYEYWGMMAKLWDFFRGDTSVWADRAFYLEAIAKYGQPVLDVGCGTGRLLVDYRKQGIDIDGVDNSPDMLVLCLEKAAEAGVTVNLEERRVPAFHADAPRRAVTAARRRRVMLRRSFLAGLGSALAAPASAQDSEGGQGTLNLSASLGEGAPLTAGLALAGVQGRCPIPTASTG